MEINKAEGKRNSESEWAHSGRQGDRDEQNEEHKECEVNPETRQMSSCKAHNLRQKNLGLT